MRSSMVVLCALLLSSHAWAAWPSLARPRPDAERPGQKDAALIIAIEDYAFVEDVKGARANGEDWDRWFEARGTPMSRIMTVTDTAAVREEILDVAQRTAAEVPPGGTLWIVYIGHGAPAKDGQDGLLVGADAQQKATSVYARSVARRELVQAVSKGRQAETVLVLDACFSGKSTTGGALLPGLQPLVPVALEPMARVTVLSAGGGDEFAGSLPGLDRPAFSYLTLGALHGWREADEDADGVVSLGEAVAYSRGALRRVAKDRRQTPEITGPLATLKLSRAASAGPDLRVAGEGVARVAPPTAAPAAPPEAPRRTAWRSSGAKDAGDAPKEAAAPPSAAAPESQGTALNKADVLMGVRAGAGRVSACGPGLGKVVVEMTIAPDGRVTRASVRTPELEGAAVGRCIVREVRSLRFPAFSGDPMTIKMPFQL